MHKMLNSVAGVSLILAASAPIASFGAPSPDEEKDKVGQRWYMSKTSNYDPRSVVGWIGILKDSTVVFFEKTNLDKTYKPEVSFEKVEAYHLNINKSNKASISIPIIGSASVDDTHTVNISITDVGSVVVPPRYLLNRCQVWEIIKGEGVSVGQKILYISSSLLSTISSSQLSSSKNEGNLGIGDYFNIDGKFYQQQGETIVVPKISVDGIVIDISEDLIKKGCHTLPQNAKHFNTVSDVLNIDDFKSLNFEIKK